MPAPLRTLHAIGFRLRISALRDSAAMSAPEDKFMATSMCVASYSALYAIARPSARPSVTWVDHSKRLKLGL